MDAYGTSPPPSSSSFIHEKYDVFLSFRGEDTRNSFTSHLYAAMKRKQIEAYIDEKSLERGDDISLALPEAIQKSKISIIIFSKGYASSSWCLRELVHILECRREKKQMVIPVFYEVDPSHVRKQEGSYGEAFLKHQENFKDRMDVVQNWRAALTESADLSGWDSKVTRPESELVEAIADDVLRKLDRVPSSDICRKDLIGIQNHIQEIELLLSLGSPDIRIVGIRGFGGVGKTTLAEALYNKHSYQFESHFFLANVREQSHKIELTNLRNTLLGAILNEQNMNLGTQNSLPYHVKDRTRRKKVLIVLDDVNDSAQLQVLIGDRDLFGCGSRIIITTRDAKVLEDIEADGTYEVKPLNYDEALELFKLKAFRGNSPTTNDVKLLREVVWYAGGIPLAINILASYIRRLYPESIQKWETISKCLKEVSHDAMEKTLMISYDGLNKKEQAIFLDIACFFKGERREMVENILNGCGFSASILINDLIDKSLITIKHDDTLWMHDLVQEMGRTIVQQQSEEQPGQQSRLWNSEDALWVLNNNEGTPKIEGIFLNMDMIDEELYLRPEAFQNMSKLRLLKIYNTTYFDDTYNVRRSKVHLTQDLQSLPRTLRYLHWERYPSRYLPSKFEPRNLVEINMPYGQLEQLSNKVQNFDNLKSINLRYSIHLTQFPHFSHAPMLEKIDLEGTNLLQVPLHSVQNLYRLGDLDLSYCNKLHSLPPRIDAMSLRTLTLKGCSELNTLPTTLNRSLVSLDLSSTAIISLPPSIDSLKNLSKLSLNNCKRLANLPSKIYKLDSLKRLDLGGCSILEKFPELPHNIEEVHIWGTAIKEVTSSSIESRVSLKTIDLSYCESLESLPTNIFKSVHILYLRYCSNLENLPEISEPIESLKELHLQGSGIRQLPSSIGHLIGLEELSMHNCENLESIPSSMCNMASLRELNLSACPKLVYHPMSSRFLPLDLYHLNLSNTNMVEIPASIKGLCLLTELYLNDCKNLCSLPELPLSLKFLDASGCASLEVVANSKRALTKEFWDYYHVQSEMFEYLLFCDCLNLDQNEHDNIIVDFQLRVLRTAIHFTPPEDKNWWNPKVNACCPGNEIPEWFEYQREGSSINMKLPLKWHSSDFLGFVVCAVGDSYSYTYGLDLFCELNLKPSQGEAHIFSWWFTNSHIEYMELRTTSNSSHVYMWFVHLDYHKCLNAEEASFDFLFKELDAIDDVWIESSNCEVKKCGIHMLYGTDLEEFGLSFMNDQHLHEEAYLGSDLKESDSAAIPMNSGTNEPHPKRNKFTDSCDF